MNRVKDRLREPSTWGGLSLLMAAIKQVTETGLTTGSITAVVLAIVAIAMPEAQSGRRP
jgi:hypothetical protein